MTLLIILLPAVLGIVILVSILRSRRKLSSSMRIKLLEELMRIETMDDVGRRILAADAVLGMALSSMGYKGGVGEQLKAAGPRIKNLNAVWAAHKLRNRIAHELDPHVTVQETSQAMEVYKKAINGL